jgi:hypothetical protein
MNRGFLASLAAVLILGQGARLMLPQASGTEQSSDSAPQKIPGPPPGNQPTPASIDAEGPWKAACDYFAAQPESHKSKPPTFQELWCLPKDVHPKILIATVPDPKLTQLALYFDRTVESITGAAADEQYELDRFWLPWSTDEEKDLPLLADRRVRKKELEAIQELPGLLIFRPKLGPRSPALIQGAATPLFVFLVGEEPTSGANKSALSNAVYDARQLAPKEPKISILGPNFSGSLQSLALDLKKAASNPSNNPPFDFRVASGGATNAEAICRFQVLIGQLAAYRAFVADDARSRRSFFDYVRNRGLTKSDIAVLSEGGTEYGQSQSIQAQPYPVPGCSAAGEAGDATTIRYPRGIAHLRNAYQEDTELLPPGKDPVAVDHCKAAGEECSSLARCRF